MTTENGVIDSIKNPFVRQSWIEQGFNFTLRRQKQAERLFHQKIDNIMSEPVNENRYVAFVAVRWGFAIIKDDKLIPTEKWNNRHLFDGHGRPV